MSHRTPETFIQDLQALCAQADELRQAAETLCASLQARIEESKAAIQPVKATRKTASPRERR